MKIAVTSQNFRTVTWHAGCTRRFLIYDVLPGGEPAEAARLDLPKEASFHESLPHAPHPLDDMDLLIAGGMGQGLQARLARKGVASLVTSETDPERAVLLWLAGSLPRVAAHTHAPDSDRDHQGDCGSCGCS